MLISWTKLKMDGACPDRRNTNAESKRFACIGEA